MKRVNGKKILGSRHLHFWATATAAKGGSFSFLLEMQSESPPILVGKKKALWAPRWRPISFSPSSSTIGRRAPKKIVRTTGRKLVLFFANCGSGVFGQSPPKWTCVKVGYVEFLFPSSLSHLRECMRVQAGKLTAASSLSISTRGDLANSCLNSA